jgi:hypothetical protein
MIPNEAQRFNYTSRQSGSPQQSVLKSGA